MGLPLCFDERTDCGVYEISADEGESKTRGTWEWWQYLSGIARGQCSNRCHSATRELGLRSMQCAGGQIGSLNGQPALVFPLCPFRPHGGRLQDRHEPSGRDRLRQSSCSPVGQRWGCLPIQKRGLIPCALVHRREDRSEKRFAKWGLRDGEPLIWWCPCPVPQRNGKSGLPKIGCAAMQTNLEPMHGRLVLSLDKSPTNRASYI